MSPSHWPEIIHRNLRQRVGDLQSGARNYARLAVGALERLAGRTIG
jgi:hypothetical protein